MNDAGGVGWRGGEERLAGESLCGVGEAEGGCALAENVCVAVDDGCAVTGDLGVVEDAEADFGADSSGVSHGYRDEGRAHGGYGLAHNTNGDEVSIREDVFSEFELERLDIELGEDAGCDLLSEGFDELPAGLGGDVADAAGEGEVVDGVGEFVVERGEIVFWLKGE